MALISIAEVDAVHKRKYGRQLIAKSASAILEEETKRHPMNYTFDIFLSHSYSDAQLSRDRLLGLKGLLEEFNYSVYVDWIIDNHLNRENVNERTAATLRVRMAHSRCLMFATSQNSHHSKWMPWELGFKDGHSSEDGGLGMVAILPLAQAAGRRGYDGQEYLGMYPYIDKANDTNGNLKLWVYEDPDTYVSFDAWLSGTKPYKRT
ncbi:hypothetical protein EC9_37090 [Rosistilla ulvae]|uniref:TIR domain-containing protein n=1 Tax=Rosistilla ulvae TaxID=1930277 RepID=A0A517M3S4_9BACT|nr:TIR domain-containing protein [Rosistilla ulvae]QDS89509.1 hypothetical protein EC9_37090 [Rosistilla ulvae]